MVDTGPPWNIVYRGTGENPHPLNKTTKDIADSVHAALSSAAGPASWTLIPFGADWTLETNTDPHPRYRLTRDFIQLKGRAHYTPGGVSTDIPANLVMTTIPGFTRPYSGLVPVVTSLSSTGGTVVVGAMTVAANGALTMRSAGMSRWVHFDGMQFPRIV
jgi:hypothetical protein